MKLMIRYLSLTVIVLALASATARAQSPNFFLFENGTAFDAQHNPLPNSVASDPSGGVSGNVLIYQLPVLVTPGDVALLEPSAPLNVASDVLRFFNTPGANFSSVIFYSDFEPNEPNRELADSGLPVLSPNAIQLLEVGIEGNNGAIYSALPGQPGATASGAPLVYSIVSDLVPEPSSAALLGLGLAAFVIARRRAPAA